MVFVFLNIDPIKKGLITLTSVQSLYSGTLLIPSPMGQKKNGGISGVAVLTSIFFAGKCMAVFDQAAKKSGRNNERWP